MEKRTISRINFYEPLGPIEIVLDDGSVLDGAFCMEEIKPSAENYGGVLLSFYTGRGMVNHIPVLKKSETKSTAVA